MAVAEETLVETPGAAVRLDPVPAPTVAAVLVVRPGDAASDFWLGLLPLLAGPELRHFITVDDLDALSAAGRLGVLPAVAPACLVVHRGYPIDWFPAPLPAAVGEDPRGLLAAVRERLRAYDR